LSFPKIICILKLINHIVFLSLTFQISFGQLNNDQLILKTILYNYYKKEKIVVKDRSQLLYLFCNKANNTAEIFEAIKDKKLPQVFLNEIKTALKKDVSQSNWQSDLNAIYDKDTSKLKQKIGTCQDLESYQTISKKLNLNNQRLLIICQPIYYSKSNLALVKVTFYRNIEHNNGVILLLEKADNNWVIKEYLNEWAT
jgi:hypothetical protein